MLGEDEVNRALSNALVAEEIVRASRSHKMEEIEAALEDARTAGASRWAWIAKRLRSPVVDRKGTTNGHE